MLLFRGAPIQCICSGFAPGGTRWNAVVFLTAFLGLHLCLTPSAVAEEPAPSVEPQKAEYAIAGFRSGRERLRSGMFRARRTTTMKYPGRGMLTSHIDYFVAFDFDRDLQRFDYRVSGVEHPTSGKYIKNQEESLLATSDNEVVTRLTRGEYPHSNPVKPFDPRNLGTMDFLVQFSRIQPFDDFCASLQKEIAQGRVSCTFEDKDDQKLARCRFLKPGPKPIAWDWILDRDRQFIPIRWERRRSDDAGELEKIPHAVLSTEWEKRNDVWVPVAMDYSASSPGNPRIEFELDWQAVNEPIAPATFTMEGFQLPPGAWIIDKRLGRPIIEGQIAPEAEQTPTPAKASTKSAPRLRRWMIVIANVVLIFGAVFFSLIYRRKTRPQNEVPPVDV